MLTINSQSRRAVAALLTIVVAQTANGYAVQRDGKVVAEYRDEPTAQNRANQMVGDIATSVAARACLIICGNKVVADKEDAKIIKGWALQGENGRTVQGVLKHSLERWSNAMETFLTVVTGDKADENDIIRNSRGATLDDVASLTRAILRGRKGAIEEFNRFIVD